jgi:hypothetical protein
MKLHPEASTAIRTNATATMGLCLCMASHVSAERQSAPTGATEPENQEGADRPLGDAACSPSAHSGTKTSTPQHPASSAEPETPEPFSRGFVAMADELLRDKWGLAILTGKNSQQDRRQLLVELILWQELGRPDLAELRERFADDVTQERVRELQAWRTSSSSTAGREARIQTGALPAVGWSVLFASHSPEPRSIRETHRSFVGLHHER